MVGEGYRQEHRNTQIVSLICAECLSRGLAFIVIIELRLDDGFNSMEKWLEN